MGEPKQIIKLIMITVLHEFDWVIPRGRYGAFVALLLLSIIKIVYEVSWGLINAYYRYFVVIFLLALIMIVTAVRGVVHAHRTGRERRKKRLEKERRRREALPFIAISTEDYKRTEAATHTLDLEDIRCFVGPMAETEWLSGRMNVNDRNAACRALGCTDITEVDTSYLRPDYDPARHDICIAHARNGGLGQSPLYTVHAGSPENFLDDSIDRARHDSSWLLYHRMEAIVPPK